MLYNDVVQHLFVCKVNKFFSMTKCFAAKKYPHSALPVPGHTYNMIWGVYPYRHAALIAL